MKLDVVTIFPEYLAPLKLSLLGKAQNEGLLEINVHDLRAHATDNHHSVDDTPYGGGAGMVMKAEVWGSALDPLLIQDVDLIVLTPGGKRFNQRMAENFAQKSHLVFAAFLASFSNAPLYFLTLLESTLLLYLPKFQQFLCSL